MLKNVCFKIYIFILLWYTYAHEKRIGDIDMNSDRLCVADLHLHTNLSLCAAPETTIGSYLQLCEKEGIKRIGISNHIYYSKGIEHTLKIRDEIKALQGNTPIDILTGCELELFYGQEPLLQVKDADKFDYILVAPSHIFNQIHHYKDYDLSTSEKICDMLIKNFKRACCLDYGVPTAICHPLYPICAPEQQEILDCMTDDMLAECYTLAAKHNKSMEIHACLYRNTVFLDEEGLSPSYVRMLSIAKECGCKFHFGSDAHREKQFIDKHVLLERAAKRAGICKDDLWGLAMI